MRIGLALISLLSIPAYCLAPLTYTGEARKNDAIVYTEKHTVTFSEDGRVVSSETLYHSPKNELIAVLKADYSKNLSTPDYTFQDFRHQSNHGLRNSESKVILFSQDKGKSEKIKELDKEKAQNRVLFGCQGLNYYVLEYAAALQESKKIPIQFLIPGNLDSYNFEMAVQKVNADGILEIEIDIDNFFLRLFTPTLKVKYDLQKKRIIGYSGLSNLSDEKGGLQNVVITYRYDS